MSAKVEVDDTPPVVVSASSKHDPHSFDLTTGMYDIDLEAKAEDFNLHKDAAAARAAGAPWYAPFPLLPKEEAPKRTVQRVDLTSAPGELLPTVTSILENGVNLDMPTAHASGIVQKVELMPLRVIKGIKFPLCATVYKTDGKTRTILAKRPDIPLFPGDPESTELFSLEPAVWAKYRRFSRVDAKKIEEELTKPEIDLKTCSQELHWFIDWYALGKPTAGENIVQLDLKKAREVIRREIAAPPALVRNSERVGVRLFVPGGETIASKRKNLCVASNKRKQQQEEEEEETSRRRKLVTTDKVKVYKSKDLAREEVQIHLRVNVTTIA